MEKKELLDTLSALTARYEQHRHYIEKARAQAASGKFNVAVIEKVVLDHEIKSSDIADEVAPLLPGLRANLAACDAEKNEIEGSKGGVDEQIQELELRAMIGELSDEDLEAETSDLRAKQSSANDRIAAVQLEADALTSALVRWADAAGPAGHYTPLAAAAEAAADEVVDEEVPAEAEAEVEEAVSVDAAEGEPEVEVDFDAIVDSVDGDSVEIGEVEVSADGADGTHASLEGMREDLSDMFPSEPAAEAAASVRVSASVDEDIAIETSEVSEDAGDAPSADVPFGFEDEILGGDVAVSAGEVEIDLSGEAAAASEGGEAPRRALLLYQEGTAEEQIYPFTGDTLTIGRGRENDIQIKNDSKVSRYHCKLFRRGNNFYIEDQKSSNGSLVNGELITDRRLFGGEEIIIGETFFRFRIME